MNNTSPYCYRPGIAGAKKHEEPDCLGAATEAAKRARICAGLYAQVRQIQERSERYDKQPLYAMGVAIAYERNRLDVAREFYAKLTTATKHKLWNDLGRQIGAQ